MQSTDHTDDSDFHASDARVPSDASEERSLVEPSPSSETEPSGHAETPAVHEPIRPGVNLLDMYLHVRHSSDIRITG